RAPRGPDSGGGAPESEIKRRGAARAQAAAGARAASPEVLERALHLVEQGLVARPEAELEVASRPRLGAEPGAGPVRGAEVEAAAVDDHRLEVHARALAQLEPAADEARVPIEVVAERARRMARVEDAQLDASLGERVEELHHRAPAVAARAVRVLDEELLQVRGRDPDADPRLAHRVDHRLVVAAAAEER